MLIGSAHGSSDTRWPATPSRPTPESSPREIATAQPQLDGLTAVVLAGGQGSRLASLIGNVPKPLVQVAGQPFLHWVTSWLSRQGVSDTVISTGHLGQQIEAWVAARPLTEGGSTRCLREPSPLGTGGAVLACLAYCQDFVLVVNGDTLVLADVRSLLVQLRTDRLDGLIVAIPVGDASRYGTLEFGGDGLLRSFREKQPGAGVVNGGIYLFKRAVLETLLPVRRASFEVDLVPELVASGARIGVAARRRAFIDIGTPEALATADAFVMANRVQLEGPSRGPARRDD